MATLNLVRQTKPLRIDIDYREEPLMLFLREPTDEESLVDSYETSYAFTQHETARAFALNVIRRVKLVVTDWGNVVDPEGNAIDFDHNLVLRMLAIDKKFANALSDQLSAHFRMGDELPKKSETLPAISSSEAAQKTPSTDASSTSTDICDAEHPSGDGSGSAAPTSNDSPPASSKP